MTIHHRFQQDLRQMRERLRVRLNDGLLIAAVKIVARPYLWWHRVGFGTLLPLLAWLADRGLRRICDEYDPLSDAGSCYRVAVDLYMAGSTAVIAFVYALMFFVQQTGWPLGVKHVAVGMLAAVTLLRTHELFSFISALHSDADYQPLGLIRAITNTVWHYGEIILAFGIFYLAWHHISGDPFAPPARPGDLHETIDSGLLNAVYFSFVTMVTLGYGDFAPQTGGGRLLVMLEVLFGFFLLVIVLQRALAIGQRESDLDHKMSITAPFYARPTDRLGEAPPIGLFKAGTRLRVLATEPGMWLVESETRVVGYVAAVVVEPLGD